MHNVSISFCFPSKVIYNFYFILIRRFDKVERSALCYMLSVCHKCKSLLLGNYSRWWDETLGMCRTIWTFFVVQFISPISFKLYKFGNIYEYIEYFILCIENIYLWSDFHENEYIEHLYTCATIKQMLFYFVSEGPRSPFVKNMKILIYDQIFMKIDMYIIICTMYMRHLKQKW